MSSQILKVKLIKQGEKLEVKLANHEGVNSDDGRECKEAVHPDLVTAMNALAVHWAIHTDYLSEKDASDRKAIECIIITSYSWNKEETGITIYGVRTTKRGRTTGMNILIPTEGDIADEYSLQNLFLKAIKKIEFEVTEYLAGHKKRQGSLFEAEKDGKMKTVTNIKIDKPADATGMSGEGKEFTAAEYGKEFDKTAALRKEGKVVPIKKGKSKKSEPAEETEFTPQQLEQHLASRKKNPGGKPRAEKPAVRKNPIK